MLETTNLSLLAYHGIIPTDTPALWWDGNNQVLFLCAVRTAPTLADQMLYVEYWAQRNTLQKVSMY